MKRIDKLEMAKLLLDVRRRSILDIARDQAVTVAQMAEAMQEKPSRLYYHVKMLEEAGLLELVETKQHGNLIEKYYRTVKGQTSFRLDPGLLGTHSDEVMAQVIQVLEPGLTLLESEMKKNDPAPEKQVDLSISLKSLTGRQWLEAKQTIQDTLSNLNGPAREEKPAFYSSSPSDNAAGESNELGLSPEAMERKSKYAFVVLSYRIEDAEA